MSRLCLVLTLAVLALIAAPALASANPTISYSSANGGLTTLTDSPGDAMDVDLSIDQSIYCTPASPCDEFFFYTPDASTISVPAQCTLHGSSIICPDVDNISANLGDQNDEFDVTTADDTSYQSAYCWVSMTVDLGPGNDVANLSRGNGDFTTCATAGFADAATIHGGDGDDEIYGGPGVDQIFGDGGNERVLNGELGDDVIHGGDGDDTMGDTCYGACSDSPDPGADTYYGDAGNDTLSYNAESSGVNVTIDGQANDGVAGENDNVQGDIEKVIGSPYADTMTGDANANGFSGGNGADTLSGGDGVDTLDGDAGNDNIQGGPGNDKLYGGADDDTIDGGPGTDSVYGDEQSCTSYYCPAGNDTINLNDGEQDLVSCGPGADVVNADALDVVSTDPNSGCETVNRPATTPLSPSGPNNPNGTPNNPNGTSTPTTTTPAVISASVSAVEAKGLTVTDPCAAACKVSATLSVSAKSKKKYHLSSTTIGSAGGSTLTAGTVTLHVKLSAKAKKKLKHAHKLSVTVKVTVTDPAGKKTTSTKTLTLK